MNDELEAVGPLLNLLERRKPDPVELRAAATTLHAFYNGVERIFSIIAKHVDGREPTGRRWHRELLQRMTLPSENRNAVIETEVGDKLLDYLGFRHRFRHSYPGTLHWNQMAGLVSDLETTHRAFRASVNRLLSELKEAT